jgi:hypothetical protein
MERLDAICGTKSKDGQKTYWTKVGSAFPNKAGGYTLYLDYVPTGRSDDGKTVIVLAQPKERTDAPRGQGQRAIGQQRSSQRDMDDEVPF